MSRPITLIAEWDTFSAPRPERYTHAPERLRAHYRIYWIDYGAGPQRQADGWQAWQYQDGDQWRTSTRYGFWQDGSPERIDALLARRAEAFGFATPE